MPFWLRYRVAWDHKLLGEVLTVFYRTIAAWYRARGRALGVPAGRCGAITQIQRFGDGLRLHPHFHTLFADGVWSWADGESGPRFQPVPSPSDDEVAFVLRACRRKILRRLIRLGVVRDDDSGDLFELDHPLLAHCTSASLLDRIAVGRHRGHLVARIVDEPLEPKPHGRRCAHLDGFSLHANTRVAPKGRDHLEKLCRYLARPAVCLRRLKRLPDGRMIMELKHKWADGTVAKVFEPRDLIAKLVPLVVRPRVNLLRYHGQFAASAAWRDAIVAAANPAGDRRKRKSAACCSDPAAARRRLTWAQLLQRTFGIDVLACACGGRRKLIALIPAGPIARRMLDHLGLPADLPRFLQPRAPPW